MIQINTNDVGFDTAALGFPAVETCQPIVLQTTTGLYGWHDALGNAKPFEKKAEAFKLFIQNIDMNYQGKEVCLLGVIRGFSRWGDGQQAQWAQELVVVADVLGFNGPIWGARLTTHLNLAKNQNAYIRFDDAQPHCTVKFKRWSKMGHSNLPTNDPNLMHLTPGRPDGKKAETGATLDEIMDERPYNRVQPTYNWSIKRKGWFGKLKATEGNLNPVPDQDFIALR